MKNSRRLGLLGLFVFVLMTGACGRDDAQVAADLKSKVASAAPGASAAIKDGVVTLSGQVDSEAVKSLAEQTAREVQGVKNVVNNLTVKPAPVAAAPEKAAPPPISADDNAKVKEAANPTKPDVSGAAGAEASTDASYTTQKGDTLTKIAKKYPGLTWRQIYEANKSEIKDPNVIPPGQKLVIPPS